MELENERVEEREMVGNIGKRQGERKNCDFVPVSKLHDSAPFVQCA